MPQTLQLTYGATSYAIEVAERCGNAPDSGQHVHDGSEHRTVHDLGGAPALRPTSLFWDQWLGQSPQLAQDQLLRQTIIHQIMSAGRPTTT